MPPRKRDPLSASFTRFTRINGRLCEVSCYGSGSDYVCRVTEQDSKPTVSEMTDGYCPPPDGGLLWVRSFDNYCTITGFVRKHLFPHGCHLDDFLEQLQSQLTVDQVQSMRNVQVIGVTRNWNRRFNGEQIDDDY